MRTLRLARGLVGLCIFALSSARGRGGYVLRVFYTIFSEKNRFLQTARLFFPRDAPSLGRLTWTIILHGRPVAAARAGLLHDGDLV